MPFSSSNFGFYSDNWYVIYCIAGNTCLIDKCIQIITHPHFCGRSSPDIDPCSLGAFIGLDRTVGKVDILRTLIKVIEIPRMEEVTCLGAAMLAGSGLI